MSEPLAAGFDLPELPLPEFPETLSTRTADALISLFRADQSLRAFARGGIDGFELEDLALVEETLAPPMLMVFIDGMEQRRDGSNRRAQRKTLIRYGVLRGPSESRRGDRWLTQRVIEHTMRLIYNSGAASGGAGGILYDEQGNPLTLGIEAIQRVPKPVLLPGIEKLLLTRVDAVFTNWVRETTGAIAYE